MFAVLIVQTPPFVKVRRFPFWLINNHDDRFYSRRWSRRFISPPPPPSMFNIISHCRKYSEPIIESEEKILWHSTKNKLFKYFTRTLIFRHSTWRWSIVGLGREEEIWVENLTQFYQSSAKQNLWTSALEEEEEEGNKPARNTEHDSRFSWKHFLPRHLRDSTRFFYHFRRKKIFEMKKEKLKKK